MSSNTQILKKTFTADLRPAYYDNFQCLADKCKVDCCTGWNINFNRKDYLKIRQQKGSETLNQAIKDALRRIKSTNSEMYAAFHLKEDGCPLLTEDKLCRLQAECGYYALPNVCKVFPRSKSYSPSGYYEYSLSPACEAVLELLWNLPEGIDFVSDPLPKKEMSAKQLPIENTMLISHFQEIRSLCIGLLQDRRFPLRERILLMGMFLQKLTAEDADVPAWLQQTEAMLQLPELAEVTTPLFASITEEQQNLILMQHIRVLLKIKDTESHKNLHAFQQMILQHLLAKIEATEKGSAVTLYTQKFLETKTYFTKAFAEQEYFFENLAVAVFFHKILPDCSSTEDLWKSYVNFCNVYSLFRFMAICSYLEPAEDAEAAKTALFCGILCISRKLLHSAKRQVTFTNEFFETENNSLSHMAMLLSL